MSRPESRPHPTHLWSDPRVQALPLSQKRMLDYCWTGPDTNGVGVTLVEPGVFQVRIGEIGASIENGLSFLEKAGFAIFDKGTMEVFVLDWFRFHKFSSPIGRSAYIKGMRETRSPMLRKIIEERFCLAGHKIERSVDKSSRCETKQPHNSPTPTSISTTTTTASPVGDATAPNGAESKDIPLVRAAVPLARAVQSR